jgi:hypothetical protein
MSETVIVTKSPKPLISDSPATQATSAASSASAGAFVVILMWFLYLFHITVPPEVSVAVSVLAGTFTHWLVIKYGLSE